MSKGSIECLSGVGTYPWLRPLLQYLRLVLSYPLQRSRVSVLVSGFSIWVARLSNGFLRNRFEVGSGEGPRRRVFWEVRDYVSKLELGPNLNFDHMSDAFCPFFRIHDISCRYMQ